jgi:hypothetical protein
MIYHWAFCQTVGKFIMRLIGTALALVVIYCFYLWYKAGMPLP